MRMRDGRGPRGRFAARRRAAGAAGLLVALALVACTAATSPDVVGSWGGPDASLILGRDGGSLTYKCGNGTVDPGWTLSADGALEGVGMHYDGGGPLPAEARPPHPARYVGQLDGDRLVLSTLLTDLGQTLGPFELERDGAEVAEACF